MGDADYGAAEAAEQFAQMCIRDSVVSGTMEEVRGNDSLEEVFLELEEE